MEQDSCCPLLQLGSGLEARQLHWCSSVAIVSLLLQVPLASRQKAQYLNFSLWQVNEG